MLTVIFYLGKSMIFRIIAFVLFICSSVVTHAEIYSWVDDSGQRHFGDEKPKKQSAEEVKVRPNLSGYQMANPDYKSPEKTPTNTHTLVMYSAAWCGYCKKARLFLQKNNIAFQERDIEKSRRAKADYKKLGGKNIPFFSYKGQTHRGFSEQGFMQFYFPLKNFR